MLKDGDDKKGSTFEVNTLYGITVAIILKKGKEAFTNVFDIFRLDIFEYINMDEIVKEIGEEPVIPEDELETVICRVMNGHIASVQLITAQGCNLLLKLR